MLQKGLIRESNSPWSALALLVPKRSTDGKPKCKFCVDVRALNSVTKFDTYPLPVFDEATSTLHGSKYYRVLDCYSGFWNIKEEYKEKTGFPVPSVHYEFNRLPFGLSNSPSSFQRPMDIVLKNLVGMNVSSSLMIIFSKSAQECALRLENVRQRFDQANLQLHPSKCVFAQQRVNYLGFVLSEQGVASSPDSIKAVKKYPIRKNVKDVRAFLGLASFYQKQLCRRSLATYRTNENDRPFIWGPEQQNAFESLKDKLCKAPVLAFPDFSIPFILTTDASK